MGTRPLLSLGPGEGGGGPVNNTGQIPPVGPPPMFSQQPRPPPPPAPMAPLLQATVESTDNGCQRSTWLPTRMTHREDIFYLYYFSS